MSDYPWQCPCGTVFHDREHEEVHIRDYCEFNPSAYLKKAIRRMEAEAEPMREAIRDLVEWKPSYILELKNPPCQGCGWQLDQHDLSHADTCDEFEAGPPQGVPFLSESYLYDLLGKDDARSLLGRLRRVAAIAGYEDHI